MIEIITTSFFVFSALYGAPTTVYAETVTPQILATAETSVRTNDHIEEKVRAHFKDDPILVQIAFCESTFRQYDEKGKTLTGDVNKGDLGIMQINKYYHEEDAVKLGYDLHTPEGNMAYAKYLYNKQGTKPWSASQKCWGKSANLVAVK